MLKGRERLWGSRERTAPSIDVLLLSGGTFKGTRFSLPPSSTKSLFVLRLFSKQSLSIVCELSVESIYHVREAKAERDKGSTQSAKKACDLWPARWCHCCLLSVWRCMSERPDAAQRRDSMWSNGHDWNPPLSAGCAVCEGLCELDIVTHALPAHSVAIVTYSRFSGHRLQMGCFTWMSRSANYVQPLAYKTKL